MEILAITAPARKLPNVAEPIASDSFTPAPGIRDPAGEDPRAIPACYRLASLATRTDDPPAALRAILESLVTTFGADGGSIGLLSADTGHLETAAQIGARDHHDALEVLKPGHGVTGWCVLNHRALLVPDVTLEPRYIAVRPSARCEMAAPIMNGDQVIGVIDLESDRTGAFNAPDLALLGQLADEASRVMRRLWELGHLRAKSRQL